MMKWFVVMSLLAISSWAQARGGSTQGSKLYVGAGFSRSNLGIKNDTASSDFTGSGFNVAVGYDYNFNEYFGLQILGDYSESRLLNDTAGTLSSNSGTSISDDARVYSKNLAGGFVIGYFSLGAGTALSDINIVPVSNSSLKYKYSPTLMFYYASLHFDYNELLRTQAGFRFSSGKQDQLSFSDVSYFLNLYFIIPGI